MSVLENSSVLITGGTGSFGKAFIREILKNHNPRRVAILSRDELKQSELRAEFAEESGAIDPRLRWFLGDIRDKDRLMRAFHGVDYVVHAAALKQVDTAEYNPFEFVKTNVLGSQNVIDAAIETGVKKVVAL
jgi:FlaA1/EpsC-like NDP-sugar epimerase